MSDNFLLKSKNSKCRRGARGAMKKNADSTVNDVSKSLAMMLNLTFEPQTRTPRRPKVLTDNTEFVRKNPEIHQMVVDCNDFKKWPQLEKKKKKLAVQNKEVVSVQTQETVSVEAKEITSVETQQSFSFSSENVDSGETAEIVTTRTFSVHFNQNVVSPEKCEKISKEGRKRTPRPKKKKDVVSTDITFEESSRVQAQREKRQNERDNFRSSISKEEAIELLEKQSKDNPTYVEGNLRINMKFYKHAYLTMPGGDMDILIIGFRDRFGALDGDSVVVCINPEEKWYKHSSEEVQKTGFVICILQKNHPRKAIGFIKKQKNEIFLYPRDVRIPVLKIVNSHTLPYSYYQNPDSFNEILFLADIISWNKPFCAFGKVLHVVGHTGDLTAETNAILLENNLDVNPFEDKLLRGLPPTDYIPTAKDFEGREDWRDCCVFTIDPATAVDLDDAVSCKLLENGNYEVSVHISDVTHYLEAFTPLDKKVSDRATTVYLVDNVYHMLPKQLCQVCSLLPGQDKLAFSVIWEMTPTADVINHRFAKTVINSCCQMAYGQAQAMIENPSNDWSKDPSLHINKNFEASQLCETVNNLYKLSLQMRERRFANGALRIDQPKLYISLDKETGLPVSCSLEEQRDSNRLIEEFMLLANMTVAEQLYITIPDISLLRSHKEPSQRILTQTRDMLEKLGVILNIESAGTLQMSLSQYQSEMTTESSENFATRCRMMVINSLCAKSMTRAIYRCSNAVKEKESLRHYALNVPLYTHFTSPIRRYSDCIVHRLLDASMRGELMPSNWNSSLCTKFASNCNVKKYSAKLAQEQSSELFFTYLLDLKGPTNTQGVVMDVKNRSINVILIDVGLKVPIYFGNMEEEVTAEFSMEHSVPTIKLTWKETGFEQVINVFSIIDVRIRKHHSLFRLHGVLLPPSLNIEN